MFAVFMRTLLHFLLFCDRSMTDEFRLHLTLSHMSVFLYIINNFYHSFSLHFSFISLPLDSKYNFFRQTSSLLFLLPCHFLVQLFLISAITYFHASAVEQFSPFLSFQMYRQPLNYSLHCWGVGGMNRNAYQAELDSHTKRATSSLSQPEIQFDTKFNYKEKQSLF